MKAFVVTNNRRAPGGVFVLHASAMPDNPYDEHPLRDVIERTETLTGCPIERAYVDEGYRGHDAQTPRRIFISGQKRSTFGVIKRELRRRSVIEPIIAHMKAESRCYLKGRAGDAANVVLSAVGDDFQPRPRPAQRTLGPLPRVANGERSPFQHSSIRLLNSGVGAWRPKCGSFGHWIRMRRRPMPYHKRHSIA
ncbi:hypothetical protein ACVWY3_004646 [Bradyrhizobium sp. USDA 4486]